LLLTVYNFLQLLLLVTAFPLLALLVLGRRKYRERFWQRSGFGLQQQALTVNTHPDEKRIWLHCLSVGEVTSALPLLRALRRQMPQVRIIVSVTTSSGMRVARAQAAPWCDRLIASPLDLLPVVHRFIRLLRPDLFILVETDFWPNWLFALRARSIPTLLINGRISTASFARYRRFNFFFTPLFSTFTLLAMQTEHDADQMRTLMVPRDRLLILGNLKYAPADVSEEQTIPPISQKDLRIPLESAVWVCGSTHPGEEDILLQAFAALTPNHPGLFLLLAPRDPNRAEEVARLAQRLGLKTMRRTRSDDPPAPILILDTLGELAACYRFARLAFVGGSLVPCGGHNPLEAVRLGVPVLFGPHMEDFREIARDLIQGGGAREVRGREDLVAAVRLILENREIRLAMRNAANALAHRQAGVIDRHLAAVTGLLGPTPH
jgi:3-deoxy-D-manno-octulosonic-acid transferase